MNENNCMRAACNSPESPAVRLVELREALIDAVMHALNTEPERLGDLQAALALADRYGEPVVLSGGGMLRLPVCLPVPPVGAPAPARAAPAELAEFRMDFQIFPTHGVDGTPRN